MGDYDKAMLEGDEFEGDEESLEDLESIPDQWDTKPSNAQEITEDQNDYDDIENLLTFGAKNEKQTKAIKDDTEVQEVNKILNNVLKKQKKTHKDVSKLLTF